MNQPEVNYRNQLQAILGQLPNMKNWKVEVERGENSDELNVSFNIPVMAPVIQLSFTIEEPGKYLHQLPKGVRLINGRLMYEHPEWGSLMEIDKAMQHGFVLQEELLTCGSELVDMLFIHKLIGMVTEK